MESERKKKSINEKQNKRGEKLTELKKKKISIDNDDIDFYLIFIFIFFIVYTFVSYSFEFFLSLFISYIHIQNAYINAKTNIQIENRNVKV